MTRDSNHALRADITDALRDRLLNALHLGRASSGHRLPSVRELAREYGVDAKVISLAYRVLSGEGLVELRARSGAFVAKPSALVAPSSSRDWLVDALVEARRRGISPRKAIEFAATATTSPPMRALIIDRNSDQLWSMSRELEADYGCATESLDCGDGTDRDTTRKLKDAVPGVDLVVTTAYERRTVQALVHEYDVPLCAVTMCSELFAEVRRLLPAQEVYFVVADTRFADKLHDLFSSARGRPNLRVLVHGRDTLEVPVSAPVYLTRLVRHLLDGRGYRSLLERGMPEARVFSDETARELTNLLISRGDRAGSPSRSGSDGLPSPGRSPRASASTASTFQGLPITEQR